MSPLTDWFYGIVDAEHEFFEEFEEYLESEDDLLHRLDNDRRVRGMHNNHRLDIETLQDEVAKSLFRFTLPEIKRIVRAMRLPEVVTIRESTTNHGIKWNSVEAMAIMLRRLAYPSRLIDLQLLFGINKSTICEIFNGMIVILYDLFHKSIRYNKKHLDSFSLRMFCQAIVDKGSPYQEVIGFIDGTLSATCRPTEFQESVYNGHHKHHGLKYQAIVTPDGITVSLCGPFAGAIHDQNMLDSSRIVEELREQLDRTETGGDSYVIYGDPAYRQTDIMVRPFRNTSSITALQKKVNKKMSSVRECVEWEFGKVAGLFAFLKFRQQQKINLSRVGQFYVVTTFLKNIHLCINRQNQTSLYFNVPAPTLEEYIEGCFDNNETV